MAMTLEELGAIIRDISCRPFDFYYGADGDSFVLQVRAAHGRDNYTGELMPWGGRKWRISRHMTRSEVVQTALAAVLAAVEHEARERFRYKGAPIFAPHFDVDDLAAIVNGGYRWDARA